LEQRLLWDLLKVIFRQQRAEAKNISGMGKKDRSFGKNEKLLDRH
jgi:hypothetical protein